MQFYDPGNRHVHGGDGRRAIEVGEENDSELEVVEILEPEGAETFEAEAIELFEVEPEEELT